MTLRHGIAVLIVALLVTSNGLRAQRGSPPSGAPARTNKQLIVEFFAFQGSRQTRAETYQAVDYVQHNPRFLRMDEFTGARGREAWIAAGTEAAKRSVRLVDVPIPLRNPIILLEEGDLAHAVYRGVRPDPDNAGQTYEAFAFEAFRIRNGQFTEHWDQVVLSKGWMAVTEGAAAERPAGLPAGVVVPAAPQAPVVPAPPDGCTATPAQVTANKQVVQRFLTGADTATGRRQRAALLAADVVDHSPLVMRFAERNRVSGRAAWLGAVEAGAVAAPPAARRRDHMIAQCDFVSVVWKQVLPDPDNTARTFEAFSFDTFRLANGRVVEHWDGSVR